jgi:hypothetical protein
LCDHRFLHLHGVNVGLVEKQFLQGQLLGYDAIGVAVNRRLFIEHLLVGFFDFAFVDGLVADHPRNLFDYVVVGCQCGQRYGGQSHGKGC